MARMIVRSLFRSSSHRYRSSTKVLGRVVAITRPGRVRMGESRAATRLRSASSHTGVSGATVAGMPAPVVGTAHTSSTRYVRGSTPYIVEVDMADGEGVVDHPPVQTASVCPPPNSCKRPHASLPASTNVPAVTRDAESWRSLKRRRTDSGQVITKSVVVPVEEDVSGSETMLVPMSTQDFRFSVYTGEVGSVVRNVHRTFLCLLPVEDHAGMLLVPAYAYMHPMPDVFMARVGSYWY